MSKIERGESAPSATVLGAIAAVVCMNPLELWVTLLAEAAHHEDEPHP